MDLEYIVFYKWRTRSVWYKWPLSSRQACSYKGLLSINLLSALVLFILREIKSNWIKAEQSMFLVENKQLGTLRKMHCKVQYLEEPIKL